MAKKILIIDDDPAFRNSTMDILKGEDYEVITAAKGSEGFQTAKTEKPDAILLDVMIEDAGTGLDVAKKLRDDPDTAGIPVIMLTGIRKADQLLESYAPGEKWPNIKAAMEKPVEPPVLLRKLEQSIL